LRWRNSGWRAACFSGSYLRLVHVADDAPPTRATFRLRELRVWGGESEHVPTRFVVERLVTVDADTAWITPDALLASWPRLRSWVEGGLENLLAGRRVTEGACAWQDAGRESAALWRGSQLAAARDWSPGRSPVPGRGQVGPAGDHEPGDQRGDQGRGGGVAGDHRQYSQAQQRRRRAADD
jgi:hypothetical protein